ncbi:MAG: hypothetical protein CMJ46_05110 [Planctomyces sp.]|nr:hypothetical protein [Planctomyces sp.]
MVKKALILFVATFGLVAFSARSEAANLSDILGIIDADIDLDFDLDLFSGNNSNNNSNNNNGGNNGGGGTPPAGSGNVQNNYFGPVTYNFFSGPTYNFFPVFGGGGSVPTPTLPNGMSWFNPIIIIFPGNFQGNIFITINIFNGPVSVASGAF